MIKTSFSVLDPWRIQAPNFKEILVAYNKETSGCTPTIDEIEERIDEVLSYDHDIIWAYCEGKLSGYAQWYYKKKDRIYYSRNIFVDPSFRHLWIWTELKNNQVMRAEELWAKMVFTTLSMDNIWSYAVQKKTWAQIEEIDGMYHAIHDLRK